ncbi:MAG: ketoacyl-synthetase C-terminal extension domain-containing protein, partial [Cyanobacteria bacterium J06648_11]
VEVQGTGTQMGDALELKALGAVLAEGKGRDRPCAVGTVKTNIGHAESAAGIAGAIEAILALYHRQLPPNLHYQTPNPLVPFDTLPLVVQERLAPWPKSDRPARAGVSAFGFGGTNTHALLEEAPAAPPASHVESPHAYLLTLSAKHEPSLRALAGRYQAFLANTPNVSLSEFCATANARRSQFRHRLTTVARSAEELRTRLEAFAGGTSPSEVRSAKVARRQYANVAFIFAGRGDRWNELGRYLYSTQSAFRAACDRCFAHLHPDLDVTGWDAWLACQPDERTIAFVVDYALACLWQQWGVRPAAVMGVGTGKYVAACSAGILTIAEALALSSRNPEDIAARSLAIAPQPPQMPWLDPDTGNPVPLDRVLDDEFWLDCDGSTSFSCDRGDLDYILLDITARPSITARPDETERVVARNAWHQTLEAIATLWRAGVAIRWSEVYPPATYRPMTLPTYA